MKRYKWIIGCLLLWAATACTEDKGNYDYVSLNDLTITGIEDTYTVEQNEHLSISVDIKGTEGFDVARYDYLWYAWRVNNPAAPDTLSHEKDLSADVSIAVGEYDLRYIVKDKETGVSYTRRVDLNVVNSFSKGVVALSSVNGNANVTFINVLNHVMEDAYESVNGEVAGSNPVGIFYTGGGEDVKATLIISTMEGSKVVEPLDFSQMMDFSNFFYIAPENQVMQCVCEEFITEFIIVGGKVYNRSLYSYGDPNPFPKYGAQLYGDYEAAPFSLGANNFFFYDQKGKRFLYAEYYSSTPIEVERPASGDFDPTNMEATMVYGVDFEDEGRAVMDGDDGERFVIAFTKTSGYEGDWPSGYSYYRVIPKRKLVINHSGFADATCFAVSTTDMDFLYYAVGNKIVCVGMQGGSVIAEFDGFAAGEQVDYMEFDRIDNPTRLYVGVSDGSGAAKSGSIYYLKMNSDGSLEKEAYFEKVCGKVVDFEYKP